MKFGFGTGEIEVNVADLPCLLALVREKFVAREGFALATLNLDHLEKLRGSEPFRSAYAAQDFVVADGNPIVWLSRLNGRPVSLVPGSDTVVPLCALAAEMGASVALLGSTKESLAAAAIALQEVVPNLVIASQIAPPFGFDPMSSEAEVLFKELAASGAGLCLLALGAPKQEMFAARGRALAPQVGFASIGAGLDFLSGSQKRAPRWVRRIAMEWAWRMLSSPRRLVSRYSKSAAILPGLAWRAWRGR